MPKTKGQGLVFGILMSVTMAYGMEVYNVALKSGVLQHVGGFSDMRNTAFLGALKEASFMWLFVFLFSNLWGNRLGAKLAAKLVSTQDSPFLQMLARSCCTVLVMCPTMSLVAAVLFQVILGHQSVLQLPAMWVGTVLKNFPMALLWNLFAAGPVSRGLLRLIFAKKNFESGNRLYMSATAERSTGENCRPYDSIDQ